MAALLDYGYEVSIMIDIVLSILICTSKLALLFNSNCNNYNNKYLLLFVNGTTLPIFYIEINLTVKFKQQCGVAIVWKFLWVYLLHKNLHRSESWQHLVSTLFHLFSSLQVFYFTCWGHLAVQHFWPRNYLFLRACKQPFSVDKICAP